MKNIFSKLAALIIGTAMSAMAYANEFYDLQLISEPTIVTTGSSGLIIYKATSRAGSTATWHIDVASLPTGVTPEYLPSTPAYMPVCQQQTVLANNAFCYIYLIIDGSVAIGTVTGAPKLCAGTTCRPPEPEDYFSVTVTSSTVPITVTPNTLDILAPGQLGYWTVQNNCPFAGGAPCSTNPAEYTAYAIGVIVPSTLTGDFGAFNTAACATLTPQATCVITAPVLAGAHPGDTGILTFNGSNTVANAPASNQDEVQISSTSGILVSVTGNVLVATPNPDQYCQTFQNASTFTLSDVSVSIGDAVQNVMTVPPATGPTECTGSIAPGAECQVCFEGTLDAYGSDIYSINYIENGFPITTQSIVTVSPTTLLVSSALNGTAPIVMTAGAGGDIVIENTGAFNPITDGVANVVFSVVGGTTIGIDIDESPCVPAPNGGTCSTTYTTEVMASLTDSPTFSVFADNLSNEPAFQPLQLSNIALVALRGQHLQYQGIFIDNTFNANALDLAVTLTGLTNRAYLCTTSDPSCDYSSTCNVGAGAVTASGTCQLWVRSIPDATQTISDITNGTVTVTLTGTGAPPPVNFPAQQQVALYATGLFRTAGGVSVNNIAKWNGTNWATLGTGTGGLNGQAQALSIYYGDLFVGGSFTTAQNITTTPRLAVWNGASWFSTTFSGTGSNVFLDNTVNTLQPVLQPATTYPVNKANPLYIGGRFLNVQGAETSSALRIAQWQGVDTGVPAADVGVGHLQSIGNNSGNGVSNDANPQVFALFVSGTSLYTGGQFANTHSSAGTGSASNVARWNAGASTWSALAQGIPDDSILFEESVNRIAQTTASNLYTLVGQFNDCTDLGFFGCLFDSTAVAYNVVQLDTNTNIYTPMNPGFNLPGNTVIYNGTSIYAGGSFVCNAASFDFSNLLMVARWTGSTWVQVGNSGLGDGQLACLPLDSSQSVFALRYNAAANTLFAGGTFDDEGNIAFIVNPTSGASNWSALGGGVSSNVTPSVQDILITDSIKLG